MVSDLPRQRREVADRYLVHNAGDAYELIQAFVMLSGFGRDEAAKVLFCHPVHVESQVRKLQKRMRKRLVSSFRPTVKLTRNGRRLLAEWVVCDCGREAVCPLTVRAGKVAEEFFVCEDCYRAAESEGL